MVPGPTEANHTKLLYGTNINPIKPMQTEAKILSRVSGRQVKDSSALFLIVTRS